MDRPEFNSIFHRIKGCTFASIDSTTVPHPGFLRTTKGDQVILFTNKNGSGYEAMVKRRLKKAGYDPDAFKVGPLPWGERIPNTPIIMHNGKLYLQTVLLRPGVSEFTLGGMPVDPTHFPFLRPPVEGGVTVNTFALDSIKSIHLLKETVKAGDL